MNFQQNIRIDLFSSFHQSAILRQIQGDQMRWYYIFELPEKFRSYFEENNLVTLTKSRDAAKQESKSPTYRDINKNTKKWKEEEI